MNKWLIRIILLIGYSIPFAFFAIYGDAIYRTMLLYALMIAGFGILSFCVIRTKQFVISILGNIISFASSYICLRHYFGTDKWEWYFKPFTANILMQIISILSFFIQICFVLRAYKKYKTTEQKK